ncbi:conotoxin Vi11.7-like [Cotesia glomerata]|uniref:conotoxin Vi11.7-like n=1 Tax=Cotesia glomerata TaxID=32391 RepID=UPI001D01D8C6|nr:conotoxin Vi11.7-like [Cotesia glomerata]
MKHIVTFLIVVAVIVAIAEAKKSKCKGEGRTCQESIECCSKWCYVNGCTTWTDGPNPCADFHCIDKKQTCVIKYRCITGGCRPVATCVDKH